MKLVVGLGNPGTRYAGTRHNVGFDVVDVLARRHSIGMAAEKFHGWFGQGELRDQRVALLKPTTFMNRSGQAVAAAVRFFRLEVLDLLVISDDLALPLGRIRMRVGGSAGSHNGLQDILNRVGSDQWCRLRIGIGAAAFETSAYVLGRFAPEEEPVIKRVCERSADAVESWLVDGPEMTMTRFNGDVV